MPLGPPPTTATRLRGLSPRTALSGCVTRTVLLEPLDHDIEIGIAGAKAPSEPVPAAFGDSLAVRDHLELTDPARSSHGLNAEALLDEGHETRDLGLIVLSRRAVHNLDLHSVLRSVQYSRLTLRFIGVGHHAAIMSYVVRPKSNVPPPLALAVTNSCHSASSFGLWAKLIRAVRCYEKGDTAVPIELSNRFVAKERGNGTGGVPKEA